MATYKLLKDQVGKSFQYTVVDENGDILSRRTSKRDYVACTVDGSFYFGRTDLIGKGDHGRSLSRVQAVLSNPEKTYKEWGVNTYSIENFIGDFQIRLKDLTTIVYI
jgi:hypothetical protein